MKQLTAFKIGLGALLVLLTAIPALAHKVRIFAWEDSGTIVTESQFSGGRPAKNAVISVIDTATGQQIVSGTTDGEGVFRFPSPPAGGGALEIVIDGGEGHKNSWLFKTEEETGNSNTAQATHQKIPAPQKSSTVTVTKEELQQIVEGVLDKKLAPIKRTLAENADRGPRLQDILGGIGYIFGLAGIAAYFQSRKKNKGV